jgi:hypothetical protein
VRIVEKKPKRPSSPDEKVRIIICVFFVVFKLSNRLEAVIHTACSLQYNLLSSATFNPRRKVQRRKKKRKVMIGSRRRKRNENTGSTARSTGSTRNINQKTKLLM